MSKETYIEHIERALSDTDTGLAFNHDALQKAARIYTVVELATDDPDISLDDLDEICDARSKAIVKLFG